jgi:hypothetical protein
MMAVMFKFCIFPLLFIIYCNKIYCQQTARASVTATIINPVGTQNAASVISARLNPVNTNDVVRMKSNRIGIENNKTLNSGSEESGSSLFHVVSNDCIYAITISYDPLMSSQNVTGETMQIESLSVLPSAKNNSKSASPDDFLIWGKFKTANKQTAGQYSTSNPTAIIVHFN